MYADQLEAAGADTPIEEPERPPTPDRHPSSPDRERSYKPFHVTTIMLLGPSGSGKSSLYNLATNQRGQKISNGASLCTERFWASYPFTIGGRSFRLIDSPGFHATSLSDPELFKKLVIHLTRPREGRKLPKLSGILYLHPKESALEDGQLKARMEALRHLVGDPWAPFITIAVMEKEPNIDSIDTVARLQAPASPFHYLYTSGAKILPLTFETPKLQEVLLGFDPDPPSRPRLFQKVRANHFGRLDGLDQFIEEIANYNRAESTGNPGRPRTKITYEESETSRQQLQLTLDETETELKSLRSQLDQTQLEYSSLRSELQLNDNTEQSKIVQSLNDLNRAIDNFGRSVAEYMVDNYTADSFSTEDPVTLDALNFAELQRQFGHQVGKSSLVASFKGDGLPIEDFIDLALRGFTCQDLCRNVFDPFHPTLLSGAESDFMDSLYDEVRRQASPIVAAKWRASSFMALSKGNKLNQPMIESQVDSLLARDVQQLVNNLFGRTDTVTLAESQRSQLRDIVTSAWELNHVLKGEVVTLGDFRPVYVENGTTFDPKTMSEFEPDKRRKPGDVAIYTVRLGLTLSHSKGAGRDTRPAIICPVTVITSTIFG
ncbi:hypothetical protein RSOLAG1IB_11765 [Rhizoctonia solani AG-1 IB]|uniref:G domain-containing protein n=1 Tax=Thanatephorus cucumeris (strain AG1-IB / isolate 7/3/14) TaxID=1108050 RepID=A0A0B7FBA0_THACB|nr:hypothetical protein RSOLAG1IB_11765 [Rhizoctonia solani AG-1 IB]